MSTRIEIGLIQSPNDETPAPVKMALQEMLQSILNQIQRADTPERRAAYASGKMSEMSGWDWSMDPSLSTPESD